MREKATRHMRGLGIVLVFVLARSAPAQAQTSRSPTVSGALH